MIDINQTADKADLIVNGFAYIKDGSLVRVINLNNPYSSAVINSDDKVIEMTASDIELEIMLKYYHRNKDLIGE